MLNSFKIYSNSDSSESIAEAKYRIASNRRTVNNVSDNVGNSSTSTSAMLEIENNQPKKSKNSKLAHRK